MMQCTIVESFSMYLNYHLRFDLIHTITTSHAMSIAERVLLCT